MWPFYWILTLRLPREQVQTTNRKTYIQFHQKTFHLLFLIQAFIIIIIHLTVLHCGALSTLVCQTANHSSSRRLRSGLNRRRHCSTRKSGRSKSLHISEGVKTGSSCLDILILEVGQKTSGSGMELMPSLLFRGKIPERAENIWRGWEHLKIFEEPETFSLVKHGKSTCSSWFSGCCHGWRGGSLFSQQGDIIHSILSLFLKHFLYRLVEVLTGQD